MEIKGAPGGCDLGNELPEDPVDALLGDCSVLDTVVGDNGSKELGKVSSRSSSEGEETCCR